MTPFANRTEAGRQLAIALLSFKNSPNTIVLALARGGVPVGFEIARQLNLPLDTFIVRKLGLPGFEELAIGAIASGGFVYLNDEMIKNYSLNYEEINRLINDAEKELIRRESLYRDQKPFPNLTNQTVILVDDGIATGASMEVAIHAIQAHSPKSIIVAVPVCAKETCLQLKTKAEQVFCLLKPLYFNAVGSWYNDFTQVNDDQVRQLLKAHIVKHF